MVVIRLSRGGMKKRPFYHVVVADNRRARNGRFIERIGFFNPFPVANKNNIVINMTRFTYWSNKGAQITARVFSLVKKYTKNQKNYCVS